MVIKNVLLDLALALASAIIEGKSAGSFCCQVAALVQDMFCNFYLVKNYKIDSNSATTYSTEKISTYLESLELKKKF